METVGYRRLTYSQDNAKLQNTLLSKFMFKIFVERVSVYINDKTIAIEERHVKQAVKQVEASGTVSLWTRKDLNTNP